MNEEDIKKIQELQLKSMDYSIYSSIAHIVAVSIQTVLLVGILAVLTIN